MSFINSFIGVHQILGVDIGTASIKIAEIERQKNKLELANYGILKTYGYLERFNAAFQASSLKLSEAAVTSHLKLLLNRSKIRATEAVASVPAFLTFSTLIETPAMSEGEIKKFVEFQAAQYVPLPIDSVTIDWQKVEVRTDENGAEKQQLFLSAIPNEQIEKYRKIFRDVGLKLRSVEVEGMSIGRSIENSTPEPVLVIDIGSRSTSLSVIKAGRLKYGGQTDFSGASLTQTIAQGLNISERRAEDLKKQRGLLGYGAEHELSTLILPMLDVIIYEAKRVLGNYESNYQEKIMRVVLSGGGANLVGAEKYIEGGMKLPVNKINPFAGISYPAAIEGISKDLGPELAIAVGLGLKEFSS